MLKPSPYMYQQTDRSQYAYDLQCRRYEHQLAPTLVSNPILHWLTQLALTPVSYPILRRPTQLAPILVSNAGLYCFNSKMQDDSKCIPKHLIALISLT